MFQCVVGPAATLVSCVWDVLEPDACRGLGSDVVDVGRGTGRLESYLAAKGLSPAGIDLSPEMIHMARRDHPGSSFDTAGLRALPFTNASLAGVACWYSPMYLAAFRPGGRLH